MDAWTPDEYERIAAADELHVSSQRAAGTDRPFITIWVVGATDALYIRSAYGSDNPWYRRAVRSGLGRIQAGGVDRTVTFVPVSVGDQRLHEQVDAAYHAKYDRYGARYVDPVVGPTAHGATLRIDPR